MLTYQDLVEVKFSDLNNVKKIKTMKDLQRAAHSQGYDVEDTGTVDGAGSHGAVKLRHRKSGEEVKKEGGVGRLGGKKKGKGGEIESTTINTVSDALRKDAVEKRGRVDKRPAAKAKRKKEAAENKARKQKNRDPFTREEVELKTFECFMEATVNDLRVMGATPEQIAKIKARRDKRGKGFSTGDDRVEGKKQSTVQKALPPSKGSAIVRQKEGGTSKEAVGAPRKTGPGVRRNDKTYERIQLEKSKRKGGPLAKRGQAGDGWGEEPEGDWEKGAGKSDKEKEKERKERQKKRERMISRTKKTIGKGFNLVKNASKSSHNEIDDADMSIKGPNIKNQAD